MEKGESPDRRSPMGHHDRSGEGGVRASLGESQPDQGAGNADPQARTVPGVGILGGLRTFGLRDGVVGRRAMVTLMARSHGIMLLPMAVGRPRRAWEVVGAVGIVEPGSGQDELHPHGAHEGERTDVKGAMSQRIGGGGFRQLWTTGNGLSRPWCAVRGGFPLLRRPPVP